MRGILAQIDAQIAALTAANPDARAWRPNYPAAFGPLYKARNALRAAITAVEAL